MKQTFKQFLLESEQEEKFSDYDKWLARCKKLNLKIDQSRDSHLYIANHCSTKSGVWVGSFDQAQSNSPGKGEILISKINDAQDENKQLRDLKKDFKNNPNDYVATDSFGNFYDEIKKFKAKTKQLKSASGNLPEIAIKDGKIIGFMDSKRKGFVKLKEALQESAPPDMEDWVKENKARFKKEYGDEWEQALYATAWKIHNQKKKNLKEAALKKTSYQVKIGSDWQDVEFYADSLDDIAKSVDEGEYKPEMNDKFPIHQLVKVVTDYIGETPDGPKAYAKGSYWEEMDFEVKQDKNDVLKISYHFSGYNVRHKEDIKKSGMITIMPAN